MERFILNETKGEKIMGLETPRSGTIQEAQSKVLNLLNPEGITEDTEAPPDEHLAQDPAEDHPDEEQLLDSDSEESSPDYNDEDEEPTRTYKLRVKGVEREVTEKELIQLASKGEDYTQKTQALSEQSKNLEAITRESDAARARMSQLLPELETNLLTISKQLEAEPDWDKLYKADPTKAARLQREFDKTKAKNADELKRVQDEKQRLFAEENSRAQQNRNQYLVEQGKTLIEKIPEWKDDKLAAKQKTAIEKWCISNGFLDQDRLNNIMDWGSVAIMRKAWLYDQGKAKVAKQKSNRNTRTLSPGSTGSAPTTRSAIRNQRETLRKTGNTKDAQQLVESLLNRKK